MADDGDYDDDGDDDADDVGDYDHRAIDPTSRPEYVQLHPPFLLHAMTWENGRPDNVGQTVTPVGQTPAHRLCSLSFLFSFIVIVIINIIPAVAVVLVPCLSLLLLSGAISIESFFVRCNEKVCSVSDCFLVAEPCRRRSNACFATASQP